MPETPNYTNTSQTVVEDADTFDFETVEQENGRATVVRFRINNPNISAGDVLLVLSGAEIHFHGMIGVVSEDGTAIATDRRGSLLPATVQ
jgi:hypothetical protein